MHDVREQAERWLARGDRVALATVVATRRSAPRPVGSKLIVSEQGELFGNYFDNVHHNGSRFEWKEGLQLPEKSGWGNHHIGFGGGLARAAFDSVRVGNKIVLTGEDADELFSVTTFTGSSFESLSEHETTGWAEDRWSPTRRGY